MTLTIQIVGYAPVLKENGARLRCNGWEDIARYIQRAKPDSVAGIELMPKIYQDQCGYYPVTPDHALMLTTGAIS